MNTHIRLNFWYKYTQGVSIRYKAQHSSFKSPSSFRLTHSQATAMSPYPSLLSPVKLGSVPLRNGVVMSALTRDRSTPTNVPNDVRTLLHGELLLKLLMINKTLI